MEWDAIKLAWLAGLVEGEGYIAKNKVFFRIRMKDPDVVQRCSQFGIGHLRGPVEGDPVKGHAPMYEWSITRRDDFTRLLTAIFPLLGRRRRERIAQCFGSLGIPVPDGSIINDPFFAFA